VIIAKIHLSPAATTGRRLLEIPSPRTSINLFDIPTYISKIIYLAKWKELNSFFSYRLAAVVIVAVKHIY
jgi:hypothetical protein